MWKGISIKSGYKATEKESIQLLLTNITRWADYYNEREKYAGRRSIGTSCNDYINDMYKIAEQPHLTNDNMKDFISLLVDVLPYKRGQLY